MNRRKFLTGAATVFAGSQAAQAHDVDKFDRLVGPAVAPPEFLPKEVDYRGGFPAGEIHVDPDIYALFWTLPNGRARRYTVGIGREGLYEPGEFFVAGKRKWPRWTPTPEMLARDPERYTPHAGGMPGGLNNPLGARALYLFQPGRGDTYLRIHGTTDPQTIGQRVSNGCARLTNNQIIEFYEYVPIETRVILQPLTV